MTNNNIYEMKKLIFAILFVLFAATGAWAQQTATMVTTAGSHVDLLVHFSGGIVAANGVTLNNGSWTNNIPHILKQEK